MKKTQILAVLALAMALGVVAPLTASAAVKEKTVVSAGEAECVDQTAFVRNVKGKKEYVALKDLQKVMDDAVAAGVISGSLAAGYTANGVAPTVDADFVSAVVTAYNNNNIYQTIDNGNAGTPAAALSAAAGAYTVNEVIAKATSLKHYNDYAVLTDIEAGEYDNISAAGIVDGNLAIKNILGTVAYETAANAAVTANPTANFTNDLAALKTYIGTMNGHAEFPGFVKAVQKAQAVQAFITNGVAKLTIVNRDTTLNATNIAAADDIAKVLAIANADLTSTVGTGYKALVAAPIFADVAPACDSSTLALRKAVYNTLDGLAREVEKLEGKDTDSLTVTVIVGSTNTGTGAEQKPAEDLEAPNTGILSTAEGSAATISIVAGLTTALTALGAGVVAYRNARRSE